MLRVDKVSKTYQKNGQSVQALREVSAVVKSGEFVSLIGPSGSGKSTFLLTVGGLSKPSSGEVFVNDSSVYNISANERALLRLRTIGFVFQTFNLLPYLSAVENVCVPMALAGESRREQKRRAGDLLGKMGLANRLKHSPAELSVGECQRVALARALANQPSILLADEPTGNLDPECADEIMHYFADLHQQGMTIIMVTHNHVAAQHAQRQLCIKDGQLYQSTPQDKEMII